MIHYLHFNDIFFIVKSLEIKKEILLDFHVKPKYHYLDVKKFYLLLNISYNSFK